MAPSALLVTLLAHAVFGADQKWDYVDTNTWGGSFPTCNGNRQSPIDLVAPMDKTYPALKFSLSYSTEASGKLFNNGHTIQFNLEDGIARIMSGGPFGEQSYQFVQLHLHWGSDSSQGSEHTLAGKKFPAEIHLVHINTAKASVEAALAAGDGLAVLGLFIDEDKSSDSEAFMNVVKSLPDVMSKSQETKIKLSLAKILSGITQWDNWFHYEGSLTTPGCNEAVQWLVMENPIKMGTNDLTAFRATKDKDGKPMVNNFRKVLPILERKLYKKMAP